MPNFLASGILISKISIDFLNSIILMQLAKIER